MHGILATILVSMVACRVTGAAFVHHIRVANGEAPTKTKTTPTISRPASSSSSSSSTCWARNVRHEDQNDDISSTAASKTTTTTTDKDNNDTIRVRIWRVLATGQEYSLTQLGAAVGERRLGELQAHLQHVAKQAKTVGNKKDSWKQRRGLLLSSNDTHDDNEKGSSSPKKTRTTNWNRPRLVTRQQGNQAFVRLEK